MVSKFSEEEIGRSVKDTTTESKKEAEHQIASDFIANNKKTPQDGRSN